MLETENAIPAQAKMRRIELFESESKAVLIDEMVETTSHLGDVTEVDHVSRQIVLKSH